MLIRCFTKKGLGSGRFGGEPNENEDTGTASCLLEAARPKENNT